MVETKIKAEKKLRKALTAKNYRLKHGYELRRCKKKKCGFFIRKSKK